MAEVEAAVKRVEYRKGKRVVERNPECARQPGLGPATRQDVERRERDRHREQRASHAQCGLGILLVVVGQAGDLERAPDDHALGEEAEMLCGLHRPGALMELSAGRCCAGPA